MVVGEKFTRNGKTYVVTQVWGDNYGFREAEEDLPRFEETVSKEEKVEEVKEEAPKKRVVRRKKA